MGFVLPKYPNALLGSAFVPPPPPPASLLAPYAAIIAEANRKPRGRSEWEDRFSFWQKPASDTEEAKIESIARRVRQAMARSAFLPGRSWSIVKQGSYHNNTNVRTDSDVDLCVCLDDAYFVDGPTNDVPSLAELNREPVPFTFDWYRRHIAWCLAQEFGHSAVTPGTKAIHLHKNDDERINADVVPAFTFQHFGPRQPMFWLRNPPSVGVALLTTTGQRITNFPFQHYANGCAKNDRTGRRYKRVVRILKRIRNHMADNIDLPRAGRERAKNTPSFLIESLVYNCLEVGHFQHTSIYDDVVAVLQYLSYALTERSGGATLLGAPSWFWWHEVNGIKSLFDGSQTWTVASAAEFVQLARGYMGV
ncbi:MAG: hypothetical protein QOJ15_11146 [Bradyrhizobium sp.]|jgi:hypothetical protein|nr:hypothetical protein [Bradyrhizobium sp.]